MRAARTSNRRHWLSGGRRARRLGIPVERVLNALEPTYIHRLIAEAVAGFRDEGLWEEALAEEVSDKDKMDIVLEGLR